MVAEELRSALGNVVVATDFGRQARDAVARAASLRIRSGSTITIVHVVPSGLRADIEKRLRSTAGALLSGAVATAGAALERAEGRGVDVATAIEIGSVAERVAEVARAREAELVVVGRGEPRSATERLLGSTAERIVRGSDASALIVSATPGAPYRRPLVGVDLSDLSRRAIELAIRVADPAVKTIDCVHAVDVAYAILLGGVAIAADEIEAYLGETERSARSLLAAWMPSVRAAGIALNPILRRGDARRVMVDESAARGSDLVAVATRGRSTLGRLLLGSVTEAVMRGAACDVLVAR
jgi:nucleotide-binding universal stress UspA family protein